MYLSVESGEFEEDRDIYVSTAQDSFAMYKYEPKEVVARYEREQVPDSEGFIDPALTADRLMLYFADDRARETACHLVYHAQDAQESTQQRRLIFVTDKAGSVVGLLSPQYTSRRFAADKVFEASLPRSITRLRHGATQPPWSTKRPPGVLASDIIGTSADGSMYGFMVLDEKCWRLLKFLENASVRHDEKEKQADTRYFREESLGPVDPDQDVSGLRNKTAYHVDGDVLERFTGPDAMTQLEIVLRSCADEQREAERLAELCVAAWELVGEEQDLFARNRAKFLVDWLRWVMLPMI